MTGISLKAYQRAELETRATEARNGLVVHAAVTVLVWVIVITVNVFAAPEFPLSIFPVAGMGIGLFVHWWFGYRALESTMRQQQREVERRAASLPFAD